MNNRTRVVLLIVAIVLAVAPLRGTPANAVPGSAEEAAHCLQMTADGHSAAHFADSPDRTTGDPGHGCGEGCGGDCCNGVCGACVHVSAALPTAMTAGAHIPRRFQYPAVSSHFTGRAAHPPYRPPISPDPV